ncbi:anthranilate phosphoribosyltransferase [Paenibacillus sp. M1]|uniref:Anthranilate phosphoribosyltransferase n=1 Tax=Paenibacillus haidiansis TaxID=1574488 RepID=A0ABU7VTS4_9BACL
MNMTEILREVGRGKRGARDLTFEEATAAAELIFGKQASDAQIGAFFLAERFKMESVEELHAFIQVCRKYAFRSPRPNSLDCAGPYDGRKSTFMTGLATSFVLAAAGSPVTLHGTAPLPPKWGVTLPDVLAEMGLEGGALPRARAEKAADETGVLFVDAEEGCPPLAELRRIREEIGLRTILNTVEKLADYGCSPYLVYGVYHNTIFDRTAQLLERLDYRRALIVQGVEGSEDVYIDRTTRVYLVENGEAKLHVIDPEAYGLEASAPEPLTTAAGQLRITEAVLTGEAHIAYINQVLLNGGLRLHLVGLSDSIEEGIYTCKSLLDSGAPWEAYRQWRAVVTNHLATVKHP